MQTSLYQVYELVDRRIAKVEEMLRAQADQVQTGQSSQFGPLYRASPMDRRRSSREAIVKMQSLQPARSEGVRVRLSQSTSTCRPGCRCVCHASRKSATPALVDRVLGKLFIGYAGLPLLSAQCDNEECQKSRRLSSKYRATNVFDHPPKDTRLCTVCQLCTEWKYWRFERPVRTWIGLTPGC